MYQEHPEVIVQQKTTRARSDSSERRQKMRDAWTPERREAKRNLMLTDNPMWRPEVKAKSSASHTGKKMPPETIAAMSRAKKGVPTPWLDDFRRNRNPMKRPEIRAAMSKTIAALGDKHPMRQPEIVARVAAANCGRKMSPEEYAYHTSPERMKKVLETRSKNASVSVGQKKLYEILLALSVPFIQECYFGFEQGWAFADAFLLLHNLDIEYDGHDNHRTAKGRKHDMERDAKMLSIHGVRTLRIGRKEIFVDAVLTRITEAINAN